MGVTHHLEAPIPVPLPVPGSDAFFTESQWQTLFALLDAVVPSIVVDSEVTDRKNQLRISKAQHMQAYERTRQSLRHPPDYEKFVEYLASRPVTNPLFVRDIKRVLGNIPKKNQKQLAGVLDLMSTRIGSLVATGYCLSVQDQPLHLREEIFQSWNSSWMRVWPIMAKSLLKMARATFAQSDPLFLELNDYKHFADDYRPGPSYKYQFMQFDAGPEPAIVETDVVIIGSGCGGGVCAKVLSEAGHRVIVVDKGYYFPPSHLPMTPDAGNHHLYDSHGAIQTMDGSVNVVAGSNWGGGGTVNWSAALHPQGFVRQEWADHGLDFFATREFQHCLDRVDEFMGVSDKHIRQNHGNNVILDGSRKLGWHAKACPQNTGGSEHYCGNCMLGCGSAQKQGPAVGWLPAAAKAGAQFLEGLDVSEVLFDESSGSKQAVGVVGEWTSRDNHGNVHTPAADRVQRRIQVKAKKVIVAGGSLHSPLLLMRSGLKNPHIGKNLHLHPTSHVNASFDQDIKGWEGGILTSVCTSFENLDGQGHGVKLEACSMVPYTMLFDHPWKNALQWKIDALRCRQMNSYIALARDRDTGRVIPDPEDGRPLVDYHPSAFDRKHMMTGLLALAKLCYIQGATEIWPLIQGVPSFVRPKRTPDIPSQKDAGADSNHTDDEDDEDDNIDQGVNDPDFVAWLKAVEKAGLDFPRATFSCAHQMGSCRMSARPGDGVVDARGRVWEARGLYVADASVFPSASGVNPMVTVMAIADWIARGVSRELRRA